MSTNPEQFAGIELDENLRPIVVFPKTYRFFLAHGRIGIEALSLYLHLIFTAELQHNNQVWAVDTYLRNGLAIGERKLKQLKAFLKSHGLIAYVQERDPETGRYRPKKEGGKVYIRVNYTPGGAESAQSVPIGAFTARADDRTSGSEKQIPIRNLNTFQENKDPLLAPTDRIITYLNGKTGKAFRHSPSSRKHIRARLADGASEQDCKAVIDRKVAQWIGDERWQRYLRPTTLFGPEKFESYLNEQTPTPAPGDRPKFESILPEEYADEAG